MTEGLDDAAAFKEEGNEKFKAKEYQAAIAAYTGSLELSPDQHLCYSNRSAAYLKVAYAEPLAYLKAGLVEKALADAEKCVELKPDWAKGYRRACEVLKQSNCLKPDRFSQATTMLQKALTNVEGEDRDSLEKEMKEVPKWQFVHGLNGVWNGTVNEALGGYAQEMEFMDNESVRVEVLGRSIVGKYWVDVAHEPHHLNIQVPHAEIPPGMPPPPPVPYIARIDEVGLHLACPYLKMERPAEFTGPGYVLMKSGSMSKVDNSEVAKLSHKEKCKRCSQELLKVMPSRKLEEPGPNDSEDAAGEKLMAQVRFESSMYSVCSLFGEDVVKEVLAATRGNVPAELYGMPEIAELTEKLRICGILDEDGPPAPPADTGARSSTGSTAASERSAASPAVNQAASSSAEKSDEASSSTASAARGSSFSCSTAVGAVLLCTAAAAAIAMLQRKQRGL